LMVLQVAVHLVVTVVHPAAAAQAVQVVHPHTEVNSLLDYLLLEFSFPVYSFQGMVLTALLLLLAADLEDHHKEVSQSQRIKLTAFIMDNSNKVDFHKVADSQEASHKAADLAADLVDLAADLEDLHHKEVRQSQRINLTVFITDSSNKADFHKDFKVDFHKAVDLADPADLANLSWPPVVASLPLQKQYNKMYLMVHQVAVHLVVTVAHLAAAAQAVLEAQVVHPTVVNSLLDYLLLDFSFPAYSFQQMVLTVLHHHLAAVLVAVDQVVPVVLLVVMLLQKSKKRHTLVIVI
jgi:hypothetical protein